MNTLINNRYDNIDEEIFADDISLDSFELQDGLNDRVWVDNVLEPDIRRALLIIAKDFIDEFNLGDLDIDDIVITGSIANYNWSEKYSDIDLHIVMDTSIINSDKALAKTFCDAVRGVWNKTHNNINVAGFPVELYIQDSAEPHKSTGVYSILDNEWIVEPSLDNLEATYDDNDVKTSVADFMNRIDELEERSAYDSPDEIYQDACDLLDDIKAARADSMKGDNVELSTGNVVFKSMRRNDYIEKLINIKLAAFDAMHSLK